MNIFVLCTGRCASMTFARACAHMANYSAGHETRSGLIGADRLSYPPNHIEVDNRLAWFLGRLEVAYGNAATYVHLTRQRAATAESFLHRYDAGIMGAYHRQILMGLSPRTDPVDVCLDYVDTVTRNIASFLQNKSLVVAVRVESAREDFRHFWQAIDAVGDLNAAIAEWDIRHNARPC